MTNAAAKSPDAGRGQNRATAIVTTATLVLILFAPALWRFIGMAVLPRGLDFAFYSYQMPLLQGALGVLLLWRTDLAQTPFAAASRALYPLIAVLLLGFLSAIFSDQALFAILHQARWILWACFVLAIMAFTSEQEGRAKLIINLVVGGFIFYAAFIHLLVFTLDPDEVHWLFQVPGYANIRLFGQYALGALMLSYYPLFKSETDLRLLPFILRILPVALCWTMVFWSGGRATIVAALATLAVLAVSGHIRRPGYIALVTIAAVLIAVTWSLAIGTGEGSSGLVRVVYALQQEGVEATSVGRISLWLATLAAIPDALVLGHGAGTISFALPGDRAMFFHPHNLVLQALFDWGAIIGTAFLAALAWLGWRLFRAPKRGDCREISADISAEATAGFALLTAMAIAAMVDGTFYHADPLMLAGVGLALALPSIASAKQGLSGSALSGLAKATIGAVPSAAFVASLVVYMAATTAMIASGPRQAPAPDSLRAKIVRTLPYSLYDTYGLYNYGRWIDQWVDRGISALPPQAIDAELARVAQFSRGDVPRQFVAVRQACARGDVQGARAALDQLDQDIAAFVRGESAYLRAALETHWGGCPGPD